MAPTPAQAVDVSGPVLPPAEQSWLRGEHCPTGPRAGEVCAHRVCGPTVGWVSACPDSPSEPCTVGIFILNLDKKLLAKFVGGRASLTKSAFKIICGPNQSKVG